METIKPSAYWKKLAERSSFIRTLVIAMQPIFIRHHKSLRVDSNQEAESNPETSDERLLYSLTCQLAELSEYFDDVFLTLSFLNVDKAKIPALYGDSVDPEKYYRFHYDNFMIRMVISLDLCAKIGYILFELGRSQKNIYPHVFFKNSTVKDKLPAAILKEFCDFLYDIKKDRHQKVHQGASKENMFEEVIWWKEMMYSIGQETIEEIEELEEHTQQQISWILSDIDNITRNSISHVHRFLDACVPQLDEIIARLPSNRQSTS